MHFPPQSIGRCLTGAIAALLVALPPSALALGMGKGQLKSGLGRALDVEIEILADDSANLSERCFKLTTPRNRDQNIEDIVRGAFTLVRQAPDHWILKLQSNTPVNEPVITVTVEMLCGNSSLTRSYTFLPELPSAVPAELPGAEQTMPRPAPAANIEPPAATIGSPPPPGRTPNTTTHSPALPPLAASEPAKERSVAAPPARHSAAPRPSRRGSDRLSIGGIAAMQGHDEPVPLKMSNSLGLSLPISRELTPPEEALRNLERRLADRANSMSLALNQYDTKARLHELIIALEEAKAIARQLPEGIELPVAAPPATATNPVLPLSAKPNPAGEAAANETRPLPTDTTATYVWLTGLALIAALLVAVARLIWLRFNAPAKHSSSTFSEARNSPSPEMAIPASIFRPDPILAAADDMEVAAEYEHPKDIADSISVSHGFENDFDDPFTAHLEAAEIMICFGRFQSAASEITDFITATPACGLRPYLALLDIYRRGDMKNEFQQLADGLQGKFNIAKPLWDSKRQGTDNTRNLDAFPHVLANITELWDGPECLAYIRNLTVDTREGTRTGFDMAAANELALLESILLLRLGEATADSSTIKKPPALPIVPSQPMDKDDSNPPDDPWRPFAR